MTTLLLVGCGKMGRALLKQWRKLPDIEALWVIEPEGNPISGMKSTWVSDLTFLPQNVRPNVIVFAVKPQQLSTVIPAYRTRFKERPLYLSIAAGKTLAFFATHFSTRARVVRAMPNLPALVGQGMTALCASAKVSPASKKIVTALMSAVGEVAWVKDEALMDAITALSGSGPAYVFLFLQCLTDAAVEAGLDPKLARQLAVQMLSGSAALAKSTEESFEDLRQQVVSPGGTTEAALEVLMEADAFRQIITRTVGAALRRAKELSQ